MKDEIKEILDKLSSEKYYIQHSYCRLFNYEANALLDYVTNLQEENKEQKNIIVKQNNRIKGAIEYIRSEYTITDDDVYLALYSSDGTLDKLENILQGEDKDE